MTQTGAAQPCVAPVFFDPGDPVFRFWTRAALHSRIKMLKCRRSRLTFIVDSCGHTSDMDKKAKKRLEILRKRQEKLRQQLAGARDQMDDPAEVASLEKEMAEVIDEIERLKKS